MKQREKTELEDFALRGMHLAKMTGVSVATHAMSDGFLLMHTGVGCKYKAAAQVAQHDWAKHPNRREAWTQVGEVALIKGSGERIGPFARSWYERRRPGFMGVVSAYFIELTGEDIRDLVADTAKSLPCPMGVIHTAAPNGGFFDGYATTMLEVLKSMDWKQPSTKPKSASTLGFFFHRYEPDLKADVAQVRQLVKASGLESGPVFFSGAPYAELAEGPQSQVVIQLPYLNPVERKLKRVLKKRDVVKLDLPIGIAGTSRFVRELTAATGGNTALAEAWIKKRVDAVRPHFSHVTTNFHGLRVCLFADGPLAAGLASLLREMGARIALIGLRDRVTGGEHELRRVVEANGLELGEDCEVLVEPSLMTMRKRVLALAEAQEIHAVIGSSIELGVLSEAASVRGASGRTALIETGFPSKDHHCALAAPTFGYSGALVWAQRVLDAVMTPKLGLRGFGTTGGH